ncbi:MAG TPA: DegT/DnrJ/EryC1/StrS family aminotransferase [Myxococcota bacterium]|nr:DegT/DnrJ/EryC1/StrS family aminotransferase [Myxococcota bacterium]HRY93148.1 DegT/DnrJ/EryC1/StrS family aminotransferase [Myxococcota bacterium]
MEFLPFALPDITDQEKRAVMDALESNWVTTGPKTKELEAKFAAAVGGKHGIAMNSCTAALHLALEAIGVRAGDEVIVPTLTFAASAEVVRYLDAKPVLVDVLPGDHTMDPKAVERAITPKTKAIMPVHFGGQACDMDPIMELARARKIPVIEDAAHSFPTYYKGKMVGSIGDITCFSFYATKTITTGEGGMAVTNNDAWAERMRIMCLHGISKDAWKRYTAEGSWYYEIIAPGYKYNLTDIASALGLVQLSRVQEMLEKRRKIARAYTEAFKDNPAIELLDVRDFDSHAWHLFVIKLRDGVLSIDRNKFIEELKALGIGTSVHFIPLHMHPYYRDTYGYKPEDFPVALECFKRSISLPIYSKMTEADTARVLDAVSGLVKRFRN